MAFEMSTKSLRKLCRERNQYSSRLDLNDILHLQCKGITKIQALEAFTGLKTIYLESNAISCVEGLAPLKQLRCLYIAKNVIRDTSGLAVLKELEVLDVADNDIYSLEGLSDLTKLRSLNLSGNKLTSVKDIEILKDLPSLETLDLSHNRIEDESIVEFLCGLNLKWLRLVGNPFCKKVEHYRKTFLSSMETLNYFDDMPAFPKDKRLALAWVQGGVEAERLERKKLQQEERQRRDSRTAEFEQMVREARERAKTNPVKYDPSRFIAKEKPEVLKVEPPQLEDTDKMEETAQVSEDNVMEVGAPSPALAPASAPMDEDECICVEAAEETEETKDEEIDLDTARGETSSNESTLTQEADMKEVSQEDSTMEVEESASVEDVPSMSAISNVFSAISQLDKEELREREAEHRNNLLKNEFSRVRSTIERRASQSVASTSMRRPVIWGTDKYKHLWACASAIPDKQEEVVTDMEVTAPELSADDERLHKLGEEYRQILQAEQDFTDTDSGSEYDPMEPYSVTNDPEGFQKMRENKRKIVPSDDDSNDDSSSEGIHIIEAAPIDFEAMD